MSCFEMLHMHPNVERDYESGVLNVSEYGGFLYWLTDRQREEVERLQKIDNEGCKVWHILYGAYRFCNDDVMQMETYLLKRDMDDDDLVDNGDGTYTAFAYVLNLDDPDLSEYGYVLVKPQFGGLIRIG